MSAVGSDGVRPIYNPEGTWKIWSLDEIYLGKNGAKVKGSKIVPLYIPNVNDYVENIKTHETFIVTSLDENFVPKMEPIDRSSRSLNQKDIWVAMGPGYGSQDHKVTIDTTVFPHRVDVSPFGLIRSVEAKYAKIISGSTLGDHRVVAFKLSPTGELKDDRIDLDLIADVEGTVNYHIKNVAVSYTTETFKNGDVLTLVLYSQAGHMLSEQQLVVVNSNFMRDATAPRDYIKDIYIDSPFLSKSDPTEIELPLNWDVNTLNMLGVVHYTSGKKVKLPIDDTKFYIEGLHQVLSSVPGHPFNLVLKYRMDRTEQTTNELSRFSNSLAKVYKVRLTEPHESYVIKLYAVPKWSNLTNQYTLDFYLFNLERREMQKVSEFVRITNGKTTFGIGDFNTPQRLQIHLPLKEVIPTAKAYIHTQSLEVQFNSLPTIAQPFRIKNTLNDPKFHGELYLSKDINDHVFHFKGVDMDTFETFLEDTYHRSYPIPTHHDLPKIYPRVTHFEFVIGDQKLEYPIENFRRGFNLPRELTKDGLTIPVVWKSKALDTTMVISLTPVTISYTQ